VRVPPQLHDLKEGTMAATMTAADDAKIQAGVDAYLELLKDGDGKEEELLQSLRDKFGWTLAEIIALQGRVVDILLEVRRK
jgi:hypothetical protein